VTTPVATAIWPSPPARVMVLIGSLWSRIASFWPGAGHALAPAPRSGFELRRVSRGAGTAALLQ
jgi:hypothetical protein